MAITGEGETRSTVMLRGLFGAHPVVRARSAASSVVPPGGQNRGARGGLPGWFWPWANRGGGPAGAGRGSHAVAPRRLVALAAIAAVAVGLGALRFAPAPVRLAVPPGARDGDLTLRPCTYPTEAGARAAECGTLVVSERRADPAARLIALPVTRLKARSPSPAEPIFYLQGGPGLSNMKFEEASRYAGVREVVLVGYRGVDGSVRLDCPEVDAALKRSADLLGEPSFRAYGGAFRACADRLTAAGVDLAGYGLPQQVDDLETARDALGYDRIDLLSQSAGTRTALIYAWRHPERLHRSVLIGANPPGNFLWDTQTYDEQLRRYADLCSRDSKCRRRVIAVRVPFRSGRAVAPRLEDGPRTRPGPHAAADAA
jgi:pimeloyl-ACP methyl ester carboxylesterase